jgi:hypothetical protein
MIDQHYFDAEGMSEEDVRWLNDFCEKTEEYGCWPDD